MIMLPGLNINWALIYNDLFNVRLALPLWKFYERPENYVFICLIRRRPPPLALRFRGPVSRLFLEGLEISTYVLVLLRLINIDVFREISYFSVLSIR